MKTTKEIYDFYHRRIYNLWSIRDRKRRDKLVGSPLWNSYYGWDSWHKIDARFKREYAKAQHREHVAEGKDGDYLWCEQCRETATQECKQCKTVKHLYCHKEKLCFDCAFPQYANLS